MEEYKKKQAAKSKSEPPQKKIKTEPTGKIVKQEPEEDIDDSTSKSHCSSKARGYIITQMKLRGFDNSKQWEEITKKNKKELVAMVADLIDKDKW